MFKFIKNKIRSFILKKATANKMFDIVEVRTKDIGLTQVTTETDIRIVNTFLLPITILSIKTDLLNRDGLKIGNMLYEHPRKIKRHSDEILTTLSHISIITSLFQAISTLLMQDINMRSVGFAKIKILWWTIDIPVDDSFVIHPKKIKILKELTEEEIKAKEEARLVKAQDREIRNVIKLEEKEMRKIEYEQRRSKRKEAILKRRHKENYIPKEERHKTQELPQPEEINFTVELNEEAIQQMANETETLNNDSDLPQANTISLEIQDTTTEIQDNTTEIQDTIIDIDE